MNKGDLLILVGAGAMAAAAAGVWLSGDEVVVLRPLQPSSDVPVFQRVDEKAYAAERRRMAVVTSRDSDHPVDVAFLRAAKRLRNSPCSASAKAEYLSRMTVYARNNLRDNLRAARNGEDVEPSFSPLKAQAAEYFDHMHLHGFISSADFRGAMKGVTPGMGLAITVSEEAGRVMDVSMGDACERRKRGEEQPGMTWEVRQEDVPRGYRLLPP